jgi:AraC-like DNA-binding protein
VLNLRQYGPSRGSHQHDHYQVLWGWRGALALEIEGRGMQMNAGRVAVIAPGERHDFWAAGTGSECFVLDTEAPLLEPLAGRMLSCAPGVTHLLRFLAQRGGVQPAAAADLLLGSLAEASPAMHARVRRAIDWDALDACIDAHLAEPLSVATLAARTHLSPTQFAARCADETGLSVMAYVRQRRLAAARRWRAEGLAVSAVAGRCGYRSPSALAAALRRAR